MSEDTLRLPDELQALVDRHPHTDWQRVVEDALRAHGDLLEGREALQRELDDPHVRWASEVMREDARTLLGEVLDARRG